ncbi:MAG: hypothetical protein IPK67_11260 [Planctomycetes bacterium]|nr:hypothetical protein [Planctomycetota bacterium]
MQSPLTPSAWLCLGAILLHQGVPTPAPSAVAGVTLPPGPAARAFAGVGPATEPARLSADGPAAPDWSRPEGWNRWAEAVGAEARGAQSDPTRRAALARAALSQGRYDDAWDHFAATGGDPPVAAALLPRFFPGVGEPGVQEAPAAAVDFLADARGGLPGPLPDGVLLRPSVPPPSLPAAQVALGRNWIERREMRLEGLRVGASTLAMRVALQSDGIQVDFDHRGGGPARVRVILPEPADFEVRVAYVDWMRQDERGGILEVNLAPGDETHSVFGRLRPRALPWPTQLPARLSQGLADHGLALCFPPEAPDGAMFRAAAPGLAAVLGLSVRVEAAREFSFPGVRVDLEDPALARRKLLGIVTLAERFALRPASR